MLSSEMLFDRELTNLGRIMFHVAIEYHKSVDIIVLIHATICVIH